MEGIRILTLQSINSPSSLCENSMDPPQIWCTDNFLKSISFVSEIVFNETTASRAILYNIISSLVQSSLRDHSRSTRSHGYEETYPANWGIILLGNFEFKLTLAVYNKNNNKKKYYFKWLVENRSNLHEVKFLCLHQ